MTFVRKTASVRADLLGGTLDLEPLGRILGDSHTINIALGLKAEVEIKEVQRSELIVESLDYQSEIAVDFAKMPQRREELSAFYSSLKQFEFVVRLCRHFGATNGLKVSLRSGSPPGAGLGGSSAMGIALAKAIASWKGVDIEKTDIIRQVHDVEELILGQGPGGLQDYYPAVYGGILKLSHEIGGIKKRQLFSPELKKFLEESVTLCYSNISRQSGLSNWSVYKSFFEKDQKIRQGLARIAELSENGASALEEKNLFSFIDCIAEEGRVRSELFDGLTPVEVRSFVDELKASVPLRGMKMCGAGGGGCFLLLHEPNAVQETKSIRHLLKKHQMQQLEFSIASPVSEV